MPSNALSRAVILTASLLAATASADFNAASSKNVVIYWGQGSDQIPLADVCNDPSVDIVNLGFINRFPRSVGSYPGSNFANACGSATYKNPDGSASDLFSSCPSIGPGIKTCQQNGKKVLLSLGGGYPRDYKLDSQALAEDFADFLWGAFGPQRSSWVDAGKPRPFGDAAVNGFDLDIESDYPKGDSRNQANYFHLVNRLRNVHFPTGLGTYYISGAPQCQLPDDHLADAISKSFFDFVFVQFYNTPECSTRAGYNGLSASTTKFTFDDWVTWLNGNSVNPNVKLYLGMPAGTDAVVSDKDSYLTQKEANSLISYYAAKYPGIFGGVMLWEATVSARNTLCSKGYATWIKDILLGRYTSSVCPSSSSSSTVASSTSTVASSASSSISILAVSTTSSSSASSSISTTASVSSSSSASSAISSTSPISSSSSSSSVISTTSPISSLSSSLSAISTTSPISSSSFSSSAISTTSPMSSRSSSSSVISTTSPLSSSSASASASSSTSSSSSSPLLSSSSSSVISRTSQVPSSSSSSSAAASAAAAASSSVTTTPSPASSSASSSPTLSSISNTTSQVSSLSSSPSSTSSSSSVVPSSSASNSSNATSIVYPTGTNATLSIPNATNGASSSTVSSSSRNSSIPYPTGNSSTIAGPYGSSTPCTTLLSSTPSNPSFSPSPSTKSSSYTSPSVQFTGGRATQSALSSTVSGVASSALCSTAGSVPSNSYGSSSGVQPGGSPSSTQGSTSGTGQGGPGPSGGYGNSATPSSTKSQTGSSPAQTSSNRHGKHPAPTPSKGPEGSVPVSSVSSVSSVSRGSGAEQKPATTSQAFPSQSNGAYVPGNSEGTTLYQTSTSTAYRYITLTVVPVPVASTPAPYLPVANSTGVYVPSGTASTVRLGSQPTYSPIPFKGAGSRLGVGMSAVAVLVAGMLVL